MEIAPDLHIRGEYWVTPDGSEPVEEDGGHECYVKNRLDTEIMDLLDEPFDPESDETSLVDEAIDTFLRTENLLKPLESLLGNLSRIQTKLRNSDSDMQRKLALLLSFRHSGIDIRIMAERHWNWIRVSHNAIEAETLTAAQAKNLREELLTILFDEGVEDEILALQTRLELYIGKTRRTYRLSVNDLGDPTVWGENSFDPALAAAGKIAKGQIEKIEAQNIPAFYNSRTGD